MNNIEEIVINTDGGSRGNPGPAAVGVVAKAQDKTLFTISKKIGENTNNVAEYTAVILAIKKIIDDKIVSEKLKFILDSELIVKQITGLYKIKAPHLQTLRQEIVDLITLGRKEKIINLVTFTHVLREKNKEADKLVNLALDN
ncbi:MAG TPA: ribonuclease HI family protein [Clostridia bacterium]